MGSPSPRPSPASPAGPVSPVTLGALVLVLCALVAATFDGARWTAAEEQVERPSTAEQAGAADRADEATQQQEPASEADDDERWLPWVPPVAVLLLVPAALVLALAVLVFARLRFVRRRRQLSGRLGPRRTPAPGPEPPPQDEEAGIPEALDESARALAMGSPRNAIVAAWVRLEQAVAGEHFAHHPEETPTELVRRVVASYHLDRESEAIDRLATLYREARFSTHPITEDHRAEASDCLRRLLGSLRTEAR